VNSQPNSGGFIFPPTVKNWGEHHHLQLFGRGLDLLLHRDQLSEVFDREAAAGLPGQVPRPHRSENRLGLQGGDVLLRLPRSEFEDQAVQPVDGLDTAPG